MNITYFGFMAFEWGHTFLPISTLMYLWAIYTVYSQDQPAYFSAAK